MVIRMNKEKYLKELEKRLIYLTDEQKQQEIFRVSNELDSGQVIKDLSNEVNEIYIKYNIDEEKMNKKKKKDNDTFSQMIKNNSYKENLIVFRDILIILGIIIILKIPFIGVETGIFSIFQTKISDSTYTAIHYIINIIYYIFAILLFIKIFKKRFNKKN